MGWGPSGVPGSPGLSTGVSGGSAVSALAVLLDRSMERMAEAAADVRVFDREAIREAADVWDNNLFPLFWAVSAPSAGERERRASTVLEWMAGLGERRRAWMTEQAAVAGYDLGALLPPAPAGPCAPGRDYLGHVMAPQDRLTREKADELAADYDLTTATVRHVRVERAGGRLTAFLRVVADRRFAVEAPVPPAAVLDVWLDGVTDADFVSPGVGGVILDAGSRGIAISLGGGGRLRAAGGECRPDDRSWHLSAAGRRADAVTPPRTGRQARPRRAPGGDLGPDAHAAALLLRHAMLELRSVRYPERADRVPVLLLCRAFSGAGAAIVAAGAQTGARRREAAFRDVIRRWAVQGGPRLAGGFARVLRAEAGRTGLVETPRIADRTPPSPADGSSVQGRTPSQAVLVMASWTAAHTSYGTERPTAAQLQLALPPRPDETLPGRWRLRTAGFEEPVAFRLRTAAFEGAGPLVRVGAPTEACGLDLHRGALHVATADGGRVSVS
ncbi:hypothetical protein [Streptomyces sp. NPDC047974]|uniref:hypothetical protein n=1 Tax=Streptomyces sp. NPDC047974 TaxID=3154343 RepID=UPI0033D821AE